MLTRNRSTLVTIHSLLYAVGLILGGGAVAADEAPRGRRSLAEELARPSEELAEPQPTAILESWWPNYPEWLATMAEIMAGNQPSASRGWYRKAIGRTRFDWKSTRELLDVNGDRRISRGEISIPDVDFDRLDLNHDGLLSAIDLSVIPKNEPLTRMASEYYFNAFIFADKNRDGMVSPTELGAMLYAAQSHIAFELILINIKDELKYLSGRSEALTLGDFQAVFELAARRGDLPPRPLGDLVPVKAPAIKLMTAFLKQDFGAWGAGPPLEARAPDFTLATSDGKAEVTLSKLIGEKPLVLIFGNFTCGPFRNHAGTLEALTKRYGDRAGFLIVYTRESHPSDGWKLDDNRWAKIDVKQPRDFASRTDIAQACRRSLGLDIPVAVDTMDDRVGRLYSGMPSRMYLIDRRGLIAYKGGRGPFGFKPGELEQSLILLLRSEASPDVKPARATNPQ